MPPEWPTAARANAPSKTVTPLICFLKKNGGVEVNERHLKDELKELMADVENCAGTVLVAWEHTVIPQLVALLPNPPRVPRKWPGDRFDMMWIVDRAGAGWTFSQKPQLLPAGDSASPIS